MRQITKEEFDKAVEAVWTEIEYQNTLPRRTDASEAKNVAGFLTLGRRYIRKAEDLWADNAGDEKALPGLRKIAAIFIRGMIYSGIRSRQSLIINH